MMIHPDLVPASVGHAEAMAAIHLAAFPPGNSWSASVMRLQLELPSGFGFLHTDGGMVLARTAADEAEILTLAVVPARRRSGLGFALLRAAMDRSATLGAGSMFLEVAVTNDAARALYARLGFRFAGQRRRYYSDGTDALVLRAPLADGVDS